MEMNVTITGIDNTVAAIKKTSDRLKILAPFFKAAGNVVMESVNRNFMAGGRPTPWVQLKPATIRRRGGGGRRAFYLKDPSGVGPRRGSYLKGPAVGGTPKPLRDTGLLMNSIGKGSHGIYQLTPVSLAIGTNVPYAADHEFGATGGSSHNVVVPARPFMMLQPADKETIFKIADDEVEKIITGATA